MKNNYRVENGIAYIEIVSKKYGRFETMVDEEDLEKLENISKFGIYKSSGSKYSNVFYVVYNEKTTGGKWKGGLKLHRLITNAPDGMLVDHLNQNTLDNRKCNLRTCDAQANVHNRKPYTHFSGKPVASRYQGVDWYKGTRRWRARIRVNNKVVCLGYFDCEIDAAISYAIAKNELHIPAVKVLA